MNSDVQQISSSLPPPYEISVIPPPYDLPPPPYEDNKNIWKLANFILCYSCIFFLIFIVILIITLSILSINPK